MNTESQTFCMLSHTGMALQNMADFCSCNSNKLSWKTRQHQVMNVYEHPIRESFHSYTRRMIAAALDHGQRHPSCQACWDQEDAGQQSQRQQYNQILKHTVPDKNQPRVLIFKPGNTCNMACRMCNAATSSSWYRDEHQLTNPTVPFREFTQQFEIIRNSYHPSNTELWGDLKAWMAGLEIIDIYGGEPFLIPGLFDMLQHGIEIGAASRITIRINTNASIWNQRYIDILKQYQHVDFKVSADSDVPAQFEYIRHQGSFEQIVHNILRFRQEFHAHPNVVMQCVLTLTSLNVWHVDTIRNHLEDLLQIPVVLNFVVNSEYDIRHLPVPVKNKMLGHVRSREVLGMLAQTIPGCDIEWPKFCSVTDRLDQLRGQSFQSAFPDWWQMLEPYWVGSPS